MGDLKKHDEQQEEPEEKRATWDHQVEFMLSCIGYAVGIGNLWRFPYLCMRNGGGAFLIPYFTFMLLCGIPLFVLELSLGQYSKLSPLSVWKICPLLRGLGWGMVIVSSICAVYYNIIITWSIYFFYNSFTGQLPWATCDNWWNTDQCTELSKKNVTFSYENSTQVTPAVTMNSTADKSRTPAEEFWQFNVLQMTSGIHDLGKMRIELMICLLVAWVVVFLCLSKGIRTSGKVVYVTATLPYLLLFILMIRGLMLPGAIEGIKYYVTPDFKRLATFKVWVEACLQIFYSLGPAWGSLITMASYNRFDNNCIRDGIIVPLVNCGTSFFAGFVIFSVIGFMAAEANLPVSEVITSGPGLAFIAYPEALTKLPVSPIWAVLFFLMLITLALDSQFCMFETMASGLVDEFPKQLAHHKTKVTAGLAIVFFLLGLPFATEGGIYVFQLIDWYSAAFSVMVIALLECMCLSWIYGTDRLYQNIYEMVGFKPSIVWKICWKYITPGIMLLVIVCSALRMEPPYYGDYQYPKWAQSIGWCVAMLSIIPIPVMAIWKLISSKGDIISRIKESLKPEGVWAQQRDKSRQYEVETNDNDIYTLKELEKFKV